jgi:hypothetical protein
MKYARNKDCCRWRKRPFRGKPHPLSCGRGFQPRRNPAQRAEVWGQGRIATDSGWKLPIEQAMLAQLPPDPAQARGQAEPPKEGTRAGLEAPRTGQ